MTEEQYRLLCETCDRLLLAPDSTIERVAIPWLHIIREHPVFLANYIDLFEPSKIHHAVARNLFSNFRKIAWWMRQILRVLRDDGQPWHSSQNITGEIDVLFISHLLNESQAGTVNDFYFGSLPDQMVGRGFSVAIVLINHSGKPSKHLAGKWDKCSITRLVLSDSLNLRQEVSIFCRMLAESRRMKYLMLKKPPQIEQQALIKSSREATSGGALTNLRIAEQIGSLVSQLKPKAMATTHEGHAWERLAFAIARRFDPNIRCIGCQHAAIFKRQHAIRRNLASEYNPDMILTAGKVGCSQLKDAPGLVGIPVSIMGSNRSVDGAFDRDRGTACPTQQTHSSGLACLVLPEGIISECNLLFEFSLLCAQKFPDMQFIWRLHPLLTHELLASKNPKLRRLPRNIILSEATLEEDIALCKWALYRGTTAIIPVVVAGLKPLYLRLLGEMTIDPLYEIRDWRISIATVSDFKRAIESDKEAESMDVMVAIQHAKQYCRDFFTPINADAFERAIFCMRAST